MIICLLFLIIGGVFGQHGQNVRPYLHWQIEFVKIDNETNTVTKGTVLIETLYLKDAIVIFEEQCRECEIRAAFRHYYYYGCQERS